MNDRALADRLHRALLEAATSAVERAERLGMPGEGAEREFRKKLMFDVLVPVLGWDPQRIFQGERFDLLLYGESDEPVVNIETKTPAAASWSDDEERDFVGRLGYYPTLRHAFITNGHVWKRFDLAESAGRLRVHRAYEPCEIDGSAASNEFVGDYLSPLARQPETHAFLAGQLGLQLYPHHPAAQDRRGRPRRYVSPIHPGTIESLAADLHDLVGRLVPVFERRFETMLSGGFDPAVAGITLGIFEFWCEQSLLVTPGRLAAQLAAAAALGSEPARRTQALEHLAAVRRGRSELPEEVLLALVEAGKAPEPASEPMRRLYAAHVQRFATQTAHMLLARMLLYRVGEDSGLWERRAAGEGLAALEASGPTWAVDLLWTLRTQFQRDLPILYGLGAFDWWRVLEDKRAALDERAEGALRSDDAALNEAVARVVRVFDAYAFLDLRVDVWQRIYDRYLPREERMKLGGYYTPPQLAELLLDLAGYVPGEEGLCRRRLVDPACGSGTFLVAAASRLRAHLERDMECHAPPASERRAPPWTGALRVAETVTRNIAGIDLHPFAAALATVNLVVQVLDVLAVVRRRSPHTPIDPAVHVADSLEPPEFQQPPLARRNLNARIEVAQKSLQALARMLGEPFDFVVGNPPWGGVLNGPLAPVYDDAYKERLSQRYPAGTRGKYDVFGPFVEHAVGLARDQGTVALVVPNTFTEKEWAEDLRAKLVLETSLRAFVDLGPLGGVLFDAMNAPSLLAVRKGHAAKGMALAVSLLEKPAGAGRGERAVEMSLEPVRRAIDALAKGGDPPAGTRGRLVPLAELDDLGKRRWAFDGGAPVESGPPRDSLVDLLEPMQGVTPSPLELFLLDDERVKALGLESELLQKAIKSTDTAAWHVKWTGRWLLYPYRKLAADRGRWRPAFQVGADGRELDHDTLLVDEPRDEVEKAMTRAHLGAKGRADVLDLRVARGDVRYPNAARYLVSHYDRLSDRTFKKRNVREFGRRWYEYIWPRDPKRLLLRPALVTRALVRQPSFALLEQRYLSDHAIYFLVPSARGQARRDAVAARLSKMLGREASARDVLLYVLLLANHPLNFERATAGRKKTPKGSYQVSEKFLGEISVPPPSGSRAKLAQAMEIAERLVAGQAAEGEAALAAELVAGLLA